MVINPRWGQFMRSRWEFSARASIEALIYFRRSVLLDDVYASFVDTSLQKWCGQSRTMAYVCK